MEPGEETEKEKLKKQEDRKITNAKEGTNAKKRGCVGSI